MSWIVDLLLAFGSAILIPVCLYFYLMRITMTREWSERFTKRAINGAALLRELNHRTYFTMLEPERLDMIHEVAIPDLVEEIRMLIRSDTHWLTGWLYWPAFHAVWGVVRLKDRLLGPGPNDMRPLVGFEMLLCGR